MGPAQRWLMIGSCPLIAGSSADVEAQIEFRLTI
jgi:hypothetical protein